MASSIRNQAAIPLSGWSRPIAATGLKVVQRVQDRRPAPRRRCQVILPGRGLDAFVDLRVHAPLRLSGYHKKIRVRKRLLPRLPHRCRWENPLRLPSGPIVLARDRGKPGRLTHPGNSGAGRRQSPGLEDMRDAQEPHQQRFGYTCPTESTTKIGHLGSQHPQVYHPPLREEGTQ